MCRWQIRRASGSFAMSARCRISYVFCFFQAEDGIRYFHVTGVQTCALPIYIAGIGAPIAALGIGLFLDHQLGAVPARFGRRLAGRAVLLDEGNLALALVVEGVGGPQVAFAGRRCEARARAPVAAQERKVLLLLGLGWHDHRLGLVLVGGALVLFVQLFVHLVRAIGTFGLRALEVAFVHSLVVRSLGLWLAGILAEVLGAVLAEVLRAVLAEILHAILADTLLADLLAGFLGREVDVRSGWGP